MVRINLLPWREQLREERQRQFLIALAISVLVGVAIVILAGQYLNMKIDNQTNRNNYLTQQISVMNDRLKVIEELKAKKAELLSRTKIIQDLQSNRQIAARLLDQFVRTLPEGVYYSSLVKKDKKITIDGKTSSNNRVAQLMRNFKDSPWLTNPDLAEIVRINQNDPGDKTSKFTMLVDESEPAEGEGAQ